MGAKGIDVVKKIAVDKKSKGWYAAGKELLRERVMSWEELVRMRMQ
jgi:hypothetical protein